MDSWFLFQPSQKVQWYIPGLAVCWRGWQPILVEELGLVGVLPYVCEDDGGVESEEDAEGEGGPLDERPGEVAEELRLDGAVLHLVHLERVDDPHRQVADQQERHNLKRRRENPRLRERATALATNHEV